MGRTSARIRNVHLSKHHGLGNDFLVAFADEVPVSGADLARGLCHRTTGIGADGLIFATPSTQADLTMTLFNADGSPAEISGNGIRCLAQALARSRGTDHVDVVIDSGGRSRALQVRPTSDPRTLDVSAEMGPVGPGPEIGGGPAFGRPISPMSTRVSMAQRSRPSGTQRASTFTSFVPPDQTS